MTRNSLPAMNNLFCGLHYLIQLGADVNTTIQAWEKMIFGEDKVGARGSVWSACREWMWNCMFSADSVQVRTAFWVWEVREASPILNFPESKRKIRVNVPLAPFKGQHHFSMFSMKCQLICENIVWCLTLKHSFVSRHECVWLYDE